MCERNGSLGRCRGTVLVHGVGLWICRFCRHERAHCVRAYKAMPGLRPAVAALHFEQWWNGAETAISHKELETSHRTEVKKADKSWLLKLLAPDYRREPLPSSSMLV